MAAMDGPRPLLLDGCWEEAEEEEEEETQAAQDLFLPFLSLCANTAMWARVPLSLFVVWCVVFRLVVERPEMLGIMAGMYQKDSSTLFVESGSGMCKAGFSGYSARRAVFSRPPVVWPLVGRPAAGSESWPAWTRLTVWVGFAGDDTSRAVFLMVVF